jgi:integrase
MFVQQWLDGVPVAQRTKAKIKSLMHRLFEKAMFWELRELGRNPMALVEIPGASRRLRKPIILTAEQYFAVLELLPEPYRTMVIVAQCLGLRVSEVLALQWRDINFDQLTMRVTRAAVNGIVMRSRPCTRKMIFHSTLISRPSCSPGNGNVRIQLKAGFFPAR